MTFEAYLREKKIHSDAFQRYQPERWENFRTLFGQVHPNSFTAQKKFLINQLRRHFPLPSDPGQVPEQVTDTRPA